MAFNIAAAKKAGYSDEEIQRYLLSKQAAAAPVQPVQTPAAQGGLEDFLPLVGSIGGGALGSLLGPWGTIGGSAAGGALGGYVKQALRGKGASPDLGEIGTEALTGGIGGVTGVVGGKILKTLAKLPKAGPALTKEVTNPLVDIGPKMAEKQETLNVARNLLGLKGSAQDQLTQMAPLYETLKGEAAGAVGSSTRSVKVKELLDAVRASMEDQAINTTAPGYKRALKGIEDLVARTANRTKGKPLNLTANDVFDAYHKLGSQFTNVMKRINAGTANEEDIAKVNAYNVLKKILIGGDDGSSLALAPEAGGAIGNMSILHQLAPGLAAKAEEAPKVFGMKVPFVGQGLQGMADKAGQAITPIDEAMTAAGTRLSGTPGAGAVANVAGKTTAQLTGRQIQQMFGMNPAVAPTDTSLNLEEGQVTDLAAGIPESVKKAQTPSPKSKKMLDQEDITALLLSDLARTGGKNISEIKTIVSLINGPEAKPLTATQQKDLASATSGLNALAVIEQEISRDPSQLLKATLPGAPGARVLETARKEAADIITRLRTGAALNENEEKFYQSQLPQLGDSPRTIKFKLGILRNLFSNIINFQQMGPDQISASTTEAASLGL